MHHDLVRRINASFSRKTEIRQRREHCRGNGTDNSTPVSNFLPNTEKPRVPVRAARAADRCWSRVMIRSGLQLVRHDRDRPFRRVARVLRAPVLNAASSFVARSGLQLVRHATDRPVQKVARVLPAPVLNAASSERLRRSIGSRRPPPARLVALATALRSYCRMTCPIWTCGHSRSTAPRGQWSNTADGCLFHPKGSLSGRHCRSVSARGRRHTR